MCNLGVCYYTGDGVEKDIPKALRLYQRAADAGSSAALSNLAWCYKEGTDGFSKDIHQAMRLWLLGDDRAVRRCQRDAAGYGTRPRHVVRRRDVARPGAPHATKEFVLRANVAGATHCVSFALSPLLLSVSGAGGPAQVPAPWGPLVDARRVAMLERGYALGPGPIDGYLLGIRELSNQSGAVVACARGDPGSIRYSFEFAVNTKWAAVLAYHPELPSSLTVATVPPPAAVGAVLGTSNGKEAASFHDRRGVVVGMPLETGCALRSIQLFPDRSVDSEVIVTDSTRMGTTIFVVDMEQTYNSGSLALLSTTKSVLPNRYFDSMIVLRNWEQHRHSPPGCCSGSRTFIVRSSKPGAMASQAFHVEESTGISTKIQRSNVVEVFRVSDPLFCVSFRPNNEEPQEWFTIYHRDKPTVPLDVLQNLQDENTPLKGGGGGIVGSDTDGATCDVDQAAHRRFFAESGFVFLLSANTVDVIEPTSGFLVLTISFPGLCPIITFLNPEQSKKK
ncbi:hypothetical protein Pelo_18726 [Pelomyxa schiedti]|nr:hypothetical protein Pelo_18726 [Pelomyxa schiedti]